MTAIRVYSVTGPATSSDFFGFAVPGGVDYLSMAANQIAKLNVDSEIKLCVGHAINWGEMEIIPEFENLSICPHFVDLQDLGIRVVNHPSAQHGAILNWLQSVHPPETNQFIVMDPDFFLTQKNGLSNCSDDLEGGIVTSGVCYPSKFPKGAYWDFPVVYFQVFSSKQVWDFSPEDGHLTLPGESASRLGMLLESSLRALRQAIKLPEIIRFLEGKGTSVAAWRVWLMQMLRAPLEVAAGDPNTMRDTGFKNRTRYKSEKVRVYQNVVKVSKLKLKLDVEKWFNSNPALHGITVPPEWYALRHGTLEKRDFTGQPLRLRAMAALPLKGSRGGPPTQVSDIEKLNLTSQQLQVAELLHRLGADLYSRDNRLLGFHLGSTAKTNVIKSLGGLDGLQHLINQLSEEK